MINNYYNYVRNLLTIIAMLIVCGNAGAQDIGYAFTEAELTQYPQKTDIPTVYLEIYKTTYPLNEKGKAVATTTLDTNGNPILEDLNTIFGTKTETYYNAQIIIRDNNGTIQERKEPTTVRGRGNATWDIDTGTKKPLRLKFPSKTALLGDNYATEKSWTLLANHCDPTLIRNAMANEVGKIVGLPFCPAYKFVDLIVNGQYKGTYQISDQVQVAPKRVDINEKTGFFLEAASNKRAGFLEDPYMKLTFGNNETMYVNIKSPDPNVENGATAAQIYGSPDTYSTQDPQYDYLKTHMEKVLNVAASGYYINLWNKYVDLESAVNAFIAEDITGNRDGVVANNYAYMNDLNSKLFFGPLWDFDLAWGCYNMSDKHFWEEEGYSGMGIMCRKTFANDPFFVKAVYDRWKEIYDNGALKKTLKDKVDEIATSISNSATLNFKSAAEGGADENTEHLSSSLSVNAASHTAAITAMKDFIDARLEWLDTNYKEKYDALGCKDLPDEIPQSGLIYLGANEYGGKHYCFIAPKEADVRENAELTFTLDGENDLYAQNDGGSLQFYLTKSNNKKSLSSNDATYLRTNENTFFFWVYKGTCTNVTLVPPACSTHNYSAYIEQSDGTYRIGCSVCSELKPETKNTPYYRFTIYPESSTTSEEYLTGWIPASDKPNSVAVVSGVTTPPTGNNIVYYNAGKYYCNNFMLTDGHPYYCPEGFTATSATYTRPNVTTTWGTLCLPFKYQTASNATASFYHMGAVENANGTQTIVLTPINPESGAGAFKPVFFKREGSGTSSDVIVTGTNISVKKTSTAKTNSTVTGWTLVGTVEDALQIDARNTEWAGKYLYYIKNNAFTHATGKFKINPFRAYLEGPQLTNSSQAAIQLKIFDGETTKLESLTPEYIQDDTAYYSLDGRRFSSKPTEKGIYIHNGRKEVVK